MYFWKTDREVPDMWHVMFDYPKKELAVGFACTFHNRHHGTNTYIFGRDATIEVGIQLLPPLRRGMEAGSIRQAVAGAQGRRSRRASIPSSPTIEPDYAFKKGELEVTSHQRDWIDCIRSGQVPRCGMDRAFEEAVTIVMSVESYFKERKVKWDPVNEQIV